MTSFKELLNKQAILAGIVLTETQLQAFTIYYEDLIETNKVMNLTALTEPEDVVSKHFLDSLLVLEDKVFFPKARVCDLGTGAGFPGIPLKIVRPDLQVSLLDSLAKRLKFLGRIITTLNLTNIVTKHSRAEDAGRSKEYREQYDVVCARGVATLSVLSEYCLPLVKVGGFFVAMKSVRYAEELETARKAIKILGGHIEAVREVKLPGLDDERKIIYIRKAKNTPNLYPRKAGVPEKNPL